MAAMQSGNEIPYFLTGWLWACTRCCAGTLWDFEKVAALKAPARDHLNGLVRNSVLLFVLIKA
jgi:hypothetical protein